MKTFTIQTAHATKKAAEAAIEMGYADGTYASDFPPYIVCDSEDNFLVVTDVVNYRNSLIYYDASTYSYRLEDAVTGVVGGDNFDTFEEAKADVRAKREF
jgi:hypothetical protein